MQARHAVDPTVSIDDPVSGIVGHARRAARMTGTDERGVLMPTGLHSLVQIRGKPTRAFEFAHNVPTKCGYERPLLATDPPSISTIGSPNRSRRLVSRMRLSRSGTCSTLATKAELVDLAGEFEA
jgi:hypothetical protein